MNGVKSKDRQSYLSLQYNAVVDKPKKTIWKMIWTNERLVTSHKYMKLYRMQEIRSRKNGKKDTVYKSIDNNYTHSSLCILSGKK